MARSTYSLRNLSHQKYRKESENVKILGLSLHSKKLSIVNVNDSPKETP